MTTDNLYENFKSMVSNYAHPQMALIPFLKFIKEKNRSIEPADITALAKICDVKTEEIIKLVDYYPYFSDSDTAAIYVCMGLPCYLKGAENLLDEFISNQKKMNGEGQAVKTSHCLGFCYDAPVVQLSDGVKYKAR